MKRTEDGDCIVSHALRPLGDKASGKKGGKRHGRTNHTEDQEIIDRMAREADQGKLTRILGTTVRRDPEVPAMTEIMHTTNDLTPREMFLLIVLTPPSKSRTSKQSSRAPKPVSTCS